MTSMCNMPFLWDMFFCTKCRTSTHTIYPKDYLLFKYRISVILSSSQRSHKCCFFPLIWPCRPETSTGGLWSGSEPSNIPESMNVIVLLHYLCLYCSHGYHLNSMYCMLLQLLAFVLWYPSVNQVHKLLDPRSVNGRMGSCWQRWGQGRLTSGHTCFWSPDTWALSDHCWTVSGVTEGQQQQTKAGKKTQPCG